MTDVTERSFKRLTSRRAESIRSQDQRRAVADPQVPGLQLVVGAKRTNGTAGAKTWHLRFTWHGRRARIALGRFPQLSQAEAHEKVREVRKLIEAGIDPRGAGIRAHGPSRPAKDPS
ncbi:MAG TPA: Arm DNA-binding domain-containing protein, partial [Burkholderiaceae bacterium]|nr:Arm DNA-binding domain-containing protein [Burkholderiaceae bacterium]